MRLSSLRYLAVQTRADIEGFVDACWDMFLTLRRGGCKMNYSRQNITEMVDGMLTWGSPTLGFLRRVSLCQKAIPHTGYSNFPICYCFVFLKAFI